MIEDPDVAERALLWSSVPDQLTGTGRRGGGIGPRPSCLGRAGGGAAAGGARPRARAPHRGGNGLRREVPARAQGDHGPVPARGAALADRCPAGRAGRPGPGVSGSAHRPRSTGSGAIADIHARRPPRRCASSPRPRAPWSGTLKSRCCCRPFWCAWVRCRPERDRGRDGILSGLVSSSTPSSSRPRRSRRRWRTPYGSR